ncbi:polymer-forming cytoskeletal protein [Natronospora cellulosivora (SeqCode)]
MKKENKIFNTLLLCLILTLLLFVFTSTVALASAIVVQGDFDLEASFFPISDNWDVELTLGLPYIDSSLPKESFQMPSFPEFRSLPSNLRNRGNARIENWSTPVVIGENIRYNKLTIKTELIIDTRFGNRFIRVRELNMGSNGKITIRGNGKVYLFVESDINLEGSSSINSSGNGDELDLYHSGNRVRLHGGVENNNYKFSGNLYTSGREVLIDGGARINGNIYAERGDINIRNGFITCQQIYTKTGNLEITNGANVRSTIISGGNKIRITGGSRFDGLSGGIQAPSANIRIDQGVTIQGKIIANPDKVKIEHINYGESNYSIEEAKISDFSNISSDSLNTITVHSSDNSPNFYLYFWENNRWVRIYSARRSWDRVTFERPITTDRILIRNPAKHPITVIEIE